MTTRKTSIATIKVKFIQFQVIHFKDKVKDTNNGKVSDREVIILYGLGDDGIVYEFSGGKWLALPVTDNNLKESMI
jgi:hypothetical protein